MFSMWQGGGNCHTLLGKMSYYIRLTAFFLDNPGKPAPEMQNHSGKINLDLLEQEIVSGSGICWAICKSASHSRQIPCQHPTTQFFTGRMPFLPPNQQHQSTEGIWVGVVLMIYSDLGAYLIDV